MDFCPCGSKKQYDECCLPIINGEEKAKTAEQLMRSRYSAHSKHEIDYIFNSTHPDKRKDFDRKSIQKWVTNSDWLGLEIKETIDGSVDDKKGMVEFIAHFKLKNITQIMHEKSNFEKFEDNWFYVDGTPVPIKQIVRTTPKLGRNDPCSCGSGKKYKKCCGK
ncbi:SEC-C motif domain protein [Candidatus Magnetomorum sp. HK-1]|nr:SEC-C motif domain protein [Candidatus Magnetomorum sp. HK-1]